ncbi:MAG: dethiobiotin synthase, partial [Burkholderiales bacterium]
VNPYALEPAIAPHLAARQAGIGIDLIQIKNSFDELAYPADRVVVEGVGGFKVPLSDAEDSADLAKLLGLPVILVVGMRLGCLNHALLTAQAIALTGLALGGWVANCIDAVMVATDENIATLKSRLRAPFLGVIPWQALPDAAEAALLLDLAVLDAEST